MKGDLELRGLSPKTQKVYLRLVSNYSAHFNRSPKDMGEEMGDQVLHFDIILYYSYTSF